MTDFDTKAGLIHRGLGVVARWPQVLLVIPSDSSHDVAVDEMFDHLGSQPNADEVYSAVTKRLREPQVLRSVAMLIDRPSGIEALLYGAVEVVVDGAIVANGSRGISNSSLPKDVARITVRTSNLSKAADPVAPFDLRQGIAPGGGLTLVTVSPGQTGTPEPATSGAKHPFGAAPAQPGPGPMPGPGLAPAQPEPSPALAGANSQAPFSQQDPPNAGLLGTQRVPGNGLDRPAEAKPALNVFPDGAGAQAPPSAQSGQGGPMATAPESGNPASSRATRAAGYLVFDDNTNFTVDRSYIVGRDPSAQPGRDLEPLKVETDAKTLSRNHAEIKLVDNSVQIIDLESTNGTFMWDKTFERWNQLAPHQAVNIRPGDSIALGRRTFVFEANVPI